MACGKGRVVSRLEHDGEGFYMYAMELFSKAGHIAVSEPEFINHSPEQFLYFDNKSDVSFSRSQRAMFHTFNHISRLFRSHDCVFFSLNLLTMKSERSQVAYNIHAMIHSVVQEGDATICVFLCDDEVLFSFMGFGFNCILSDWYPLDDDCHQLLDRLDIGNISIESGVDYFSDMVYALARSYYLSPAKPIFYTLFPHTFFFGAMFNEIDREELNQIINYELSKPRREYGDDYVEYDEFSTSQTVDIGAYLDLMLLEIDNEVENPSSFF